jgi:Na+-translocating ferredoxin:NAD+ oxidoreductase RnfE subunit
MWNLAFILLWYKAPSRTTMLFAINVFFYILMDLLSIEEPAFTFTLWTKLVEWILLITSFCDQFGNCHYLTNKIFYSIWEHTWVELGITGNLRSGSFTTPTWIIIHKLVSVSCIPFYFSVLLFEASILFLILPPVSLQYGYHKQKYLP